MSQDQNTERSTAAVMHRLEQLASWLQETSQNWSRQIEAHIVAWYQRILDPDQYYEFLVTVARYISHGTLLTLVALTTLVARLFVVRTSAEATAAAEQPLVLKAPSPHMFSNASNTRLLNALTNRASVVVADDFPITRAFVLHREEEQQAVRTAIITYTVQEGDNIALIAQRFNLQPSTIVWANKEVEEDPNILLIGQVLNILPTDGVLYEVQPNDTLSGIAERFKVKMEDIIAYPLNNLANGANLVPGQRIIVPGGVKPTPRRMVGVNQPRRMVPGTRYIGPAPSFVASGTFIWPARGYLSQGYHSQHRAIDIANATGTPIVAADGGYVTFAGWSPVGYGYMVTLDHGNGFTTLYAHLNQWYVNPGQSVVPGQVIGAMGSTGRSTGPHLHFEIRYNGALLNPLIYLR